MLATKRRCHILKQLFNLATVYKVEVVSHWLNYTKEELQKILQEAIKKQIETEGNEITIEVQERK